MAGQGGKNSGIIQTLVAIVREEGFAVLYRGIGGPLGVEPIKRAVKFTTQAYYASIAPAGLLGQFISGALAGMTEVIVIAPTEIVKVRLQSKDYKSIYKSGTVDAMKQIVRDEGPLTLLKGLEAGLWRQGVYNGSLFGWTALFKQLWTEPAGYGAGLWRNFVCGAVAGTLGVSSFNIPFDVVCTRNRNLPRGTPALWAWCAPTPPLAHDSSRTGSHDGCCRAYIFKVWKEEGFGAIYRGYIAKVSRLGPGGGVMIMVVDVVNGLLNRMFG